MWGLAERKWGSWIDVGVLGGEWGWEGLRGYPKSTSKRLVSLPYAAS